MFSVNNCDMKRFLFTTALIAVIIGVMLYFVPKPMQADVNSYADRNAVVSVYCRNTDLEYVDMGLGRLVTCTVSDFEATIANCDGVDGVSIAFKGSFGDIDAVVKRLNARNVNSQQLGDTYVACYYSSLIRDRAVVDGKEVNVQIAYRNGTVTVGYPLILGSY